MTLELNLSGDGWQERLAVIRRFRVKRAAVSFYNDYSMQLAVREFKSKLVPETDVGIYRTESGFLILVSSPKETPGVVETGVLGMKMLPVELWPGWVTYYTVLGTVEEMKGFFNGKRQALLSGESILT